MIFSAKAFVILTAATYVLHSVSVKLSAGKIDPYTMILFWSLGGLVVGLTAYTYGKLGNHIQFTSQGVLYSSIAGLSIAIGSLGYILAFTRNVEFSFATPLVNISVVTGGVVFGYLIFSENISPARMLGLALGIASIFLLARS